MQTPRVYETSALSAHRREVALVRWPLDAVPAQRVEAAAADPLTGREPRVRPQDAFSRTW